MRALSVSLALVVAGCGARTVTTHSDGATARDTSPAPDSTIVDAQIDGSAETGRVAAVLRTCELLTRCGRDGLIRRAPPWQTPLSMESCIATFGGRPDPLQSAFYPPVYQPMMEHFLRCSGVTDCNDFADCAGTWYSPSACFEGGICTSPTVVEVLGLPAQSPRFDCASIGLECVDLATGAQRACCSEPPTLPCGCQSTTEANVCGAAGGGWRIDCGVLGLECNLDISTPIASPCRGTGAACSQDTPVVCNGSVATYCHGGRLATYDCRQNPFFSACAPGPAEPHQLPCQPASNGCTERCENDQLIVCVDGAEHRIDCSAIAFACTSIDVFRCTSVPF